jgi:hypothetical protein
LSSAFQDHLINAGIDSREVSVRSALKLSVPFSPGGKGVLQLTPRISRSCGGTYGLDGGSVPSEEEFRILGRDLGILLLKPPLYYLNPRFNVGRLNEYGAVDRLADATGILELVETSLATALGIDARLHDPPWYLPARSSLEVSGDTGREGESYSQLRSLEFGIGRDFSSLSLDAAWTGSWDYASKVVSHSLSVDTGFDLSEGIRGRLAVEHGITFTKERQRVGAEELFLFPGQPAREIEVSFQPDRDTVVSVLGLEYAWEKRFESPDGTGRPGRIRHTQRLELENTFLDADRTELSDTTVVPLRLLFSHSTIMTVSQYMDLQFDVKTIGGVEEIITSGQSSFQPALGFELRLTGILNF